MKKSSFKFIIPLMVLLIAALLLSACNLPLGSTAASSSGTSDSNSGSSAAAATSAPQSGGNCLVGKWSLTDMTAYITSIESNMSSASGQTITITTGDFTGTMFFTFNADGSASLEGDNYTENFTMGMSAGGQNLSIPMSININGTSTSTYSVEGDKVSFTDQQPGTMKVMITTSGSTSEMDETLFGKAGTTQLYQYSCPDANTLSLKVIAVQNMDLAPLTLTRVK